MRSVLARRGGVSAARGAVASAKPVGHTARRLVSSSTARPLSEVDPEVHSLIHEEYERQKYGIELIASEVPPIISFQLNEDLYKWLLIFMHLPWWLALPMDINLARILKSLSINLSNV